MRLRGFLLLSLVVAFTLLNLVGQLLGLYIDWLWFREVQFTSVFLTVLRTQLLLGAVTAGAFFLILYGNVLLARRLAPREALVGADDPSGCPAPRSWSPTFAGWPCPGA